MKSPAAYSTSRSSLLLPTPSGGAGPPVVLNTGFDMRSARSENQSPARGIQNCRQAEGQRPRRATVTAIMADPDRPGVGTERVGQQLAPARLRGERPVADIQVPNHQPRQPLEASRETKLGEHPIDPIRRFAHVFEQQDGAF